MASTFDLRALRQHWFVPLYALALAGTWLMSRASPQPPGWDIAILLDFGLVMPLLYLVCYRRELSWRRTAPKLLAMLCGAIFLAAWLVEPDKQLAVDELGWLRLAGLALLVALEGVLLIEVVKAVFSRDADVRTIAAMGVPPVLARLMLAEARFWKWVASLLRR